MSEPSLFPSSSLTWVVSIPEAQEKLWGTFICVSSSTLLKLCRGGEEEAEEGASGHLGFSSQLCYKPAVTVGKSVCLA